jgi:hypothetical protein
MSDEVKEKEEFEEGISVMCDDGIARDTISRKTAMESGKTRYFTGTACKNGHIAERKVKGFVCVICGRLRQKERMKTRLESDPDYKAKMAEKRKEKHKERYANDPEYRQRILDRGKATRKARKGKLAEAEAQVSA